MQIESQLELKPKTDFTASPTWQTKPDKSQAVSQLFKLNKLQLSSLFASVSVLTVGYFALPAPQASTPAVTATPAPQKTTPVDSQAELQAKLLSAPLPVSPTSLEAIKQNKLLRVATVNDGTTYSIDNSVGTNFAHGYGYDVARRYAHKLKVDLKVIAYDNEQSALEAVKVGKADMALTNATAQVKTASTATPLAKENAQAKPSDFQKASYSPKPATATSQPQSSQATEKTSSHAQALTSVSLSCNQNFLGQFGLNTNVNWTIPSSAQDLVSNAKAFLCDSKQIALNKKTAEFYQQTTLNDPYSREHFVSTMKTSLPTYRNAFVQNAKTYDHDWRLLVAMGYQESQLKPDAVSPTGVRGLMMLTNDTAEAMGVANRNDPIQSIAGGAKYMAQLNKQFADVPNPDRLWFSLAAYNMGPSAVNAIQNTLNAEGKNGNSWSEVYLFLSQHATENPRYYQCLTYVGHIRGYLDALKAQQMTAPQSALSVA